jgi:hypothetical protein
MRRLLPIVAILVIGSYAGVGDSADHQDGPVASSHREADITDLFVFPVLAADGARRLVLAMTLNASPFPGQQFSDALVYRFRLRPVQITGSGAATRTATSPEGEVHVACTFAVDPAGAPGRITCRTAPASLPGLPGDGTCAAGPCLEQSAIVDDVATPPPEAASPPMRVFAGLRADPFFSNVRRVREFKRDRDGDRSTRSLNTFIAHNALGLVVELDIDDVLGTQSGRWAVVAETLRRP